MKTFLIALCLFLAVTPAYGATVLLVDGTVLKGEIVSESESEVVVTDLNKSDTPSVSKQAQFVLGD